MSTGAIQRAPAAANVNAAIATAQIFPASAPLGSIGAAAAAAIAAMLVCPGSGRLEQKPFTIRASGNATTAGAFTVAITLYAAIAQPAATLTPGSWTAIATTAAVAIGTTSAPWLLECECVFRIASRKALRAVLQQHQQHLCRWVGDHTDRIRDQRRHRAGDCLRCRYHFQLRQRRKHRPSRRLQSQRLATKVELNRRGERACGHSRMPEQEGGRRPPPTPPSQQSKKEFDHG
jgi:hypothetical protein